MLQQLQLLVFATLAFMLLQWRRWYPAEQPGLIIDVEWLWRRGWPMLMRGRGPAGAEGGAVRVRRGWCSRRIGAAGGRGRCSGRDGWVATKVPLSATAVLSLAILGVVLAISLFS